MFLYGEGAGCDHTHIHNMTYRIKRRELCVEFCFYLLPFYFSSPFFFMDFSLFGENISNTPRNKSVNLGNFPHFHEIEGQQNFVTESISHGISSMIGTLFHQKHPTCIAHFFNYSQLSVRVGITLKVPLAIDQPCFSTFLAKPKAKKTQGFR